MLLLCSIMCVLSVISFGIELLIGELFVMLLLIVFVLWIGSDVKCFYILVSFGYVLVSVV